MVHKSVLHAPLETDRIVETLSCGGVVLLPTDTVLGLAAKPAFSDAVSKVYALKARAPSKNLPIMVSSTQQIKDLGGVISLDATALLHSKYVPGPLTLAVGVDPDRLAHWLKDRFEFAVRIPRDPLLLSILEKTGPLLVTSANLSGQETPHSTDEVLKQLNGTPDYVVAGHAKSQIPSTLVNCRVTPAKIERIGAVSKAEVNAILEHTDD